MEPNKKREIEKKVFFGLYTLIPIVSALYFFIDASHLRVGIANLF